MPVFTVHLMAGLRAVAAAMTAGASQERGARERHDLAGTSRTCASRADGEDAPRSPLEVLPEPYVSGSAKPNASSSCRRATVAACSRRLQDHNGVVTLLGAA